MPAFLSQASTPRKKRRLLAETLEDRILFSATPTAAVTVGGQPFLGSATSVAINFSNTGSSTGYGPYLMVVLKNQLNTAGDELTVTGAPTYLGTSLTYSTATLSSTGTITNPYATDSSGNPVTYTLAQVNALTGQTYTAGDQVLFIQLPFGSYTVGQPAATVNLSVQTSQNAPLTALPIAAIGGFQYGNDALNNPTTDPSILGTADPTTITPQLAVLTKTYLGSEGETATGPDFPESYEVSAQIASGQTLSDFTLSDPLSSDLQYIGLTSVKIDGTATTAYTLVSTPSTSATGGTLSIELNNPVTGTGSDDDVAVVFSYYVPYNTADTTSPTNTILGASNGSFNGSITNQATGSADWAGNANSAATTLSLTSNTVDLTAKSIAVQKTFYDVTQNSTDAGTIEPGDVIEFTLNFQISDYYGFNALSLTDILSDGLQLDTTPGSPQLTLSGFTQGGAVTGVSGLNLNPYTTVTGPSSGGANGDQTLLFNISNALATADAGSDGILLGGQVNPSTGALLSSAAGATTGTIVYYAQVQTTFVNPNSYNVATTNYLVPGDTLTNTVQSLTGTVLTPGTLTGSANTQSDGSGVTLSISPDTIEKSIFAVNGQNPDLYEDANGNINISPGDVVTYEIVFTAPSGDADTLSLADFLPLPIFEANDPTAVGNTSSYTWTFNNTVVSTYGAAPAAGTAAYGAAQSLVATSGTVPTITTSSTANSLDFTVGNATNASSTSRVEDILFSVKAEDNPFADGLILTNLAQSTQTDSSTVLTATAPAIIHVVLDEPNVTLYKGVVGSTQGGSVGTVTGDIAFNSLTAGFTGTLESAADATAIGNLNLTSGTLPEESDSVRFAIVVQNTGHGDAYDVSFSDVIPEDYVSAYGSAQAFVTGTHFQVYTGSGNALTYDSTNSGAAGEYKLVFTPASGSTPAGFTVTLNDGTNSGALSSGITVSNGVSTATTDGTNSVIALFSLSLASSGIAAGTVVTNTAELTNYTNLQGNTNFVPSGQKDTATVDVSAPGLVKALAGIGLAGTSDNSNAQTSGTIGDVVTYTLTFTVPEGTAYGASIVDTLDAGLTFIGIDSAVYSGSISATGGTIGTGATPANVTIGNVNGGTDNLLTFNLGNTTGSTSTPASNVIVITYDARVDNVVGTQSGSQLTNSANLSYTQTTDNPGATQVAYTPTTATTSITSNAANVAIVTPDVTEAKTVVTAGPYHVGDVVTYQVVLTNNGGATAYDVALADSAPAGLTFKSVTSTVLDGGATVATAPVITSGSLTGSYDLPVGASVTVQYTAQIGASITLISTTQTNTANITWNSQNGGTYGRNGSDGSSGALNNYAASATASVFVINGVPDLTVTDTASKTINLIDQPFNYTLTVQDIGYGFVTGVTVVDHLSSTLQFISADNGGVYHAATHTITWVVSGTFLGDALQTATFHVQAVLPTTTSLVYGVLPNNATVTDDHTYGLDSNLLNNSANAPVTAIAFLYDQLQNAANYSPFSAAPGQDYGPHYHGYPQGYGPLPYNLPLLTVSPMYSGSSDPDSTLVVDLYNALGVKVGSQSILSDAGGNWMVDFPDTVLRDYPQTVTISEQPSSSEAPGQSGFNLRTYFSPAINSSHFFTQPLNVDNVYSQSSANIVREMYEAALHPINFDVTKNTYEFLSSAGTPAGS